MTAGDTSSDAVRGGATVDVAAPHRRSLRVLMVSQLLGGAGLTVGALLAKDMLGSTRLSGLPAGLFTLGTVLRDLSVLGSSSCSPWDVLERVQRTLSSPASIATKGVRQ
jgi:hypothetical protein